MLHPYMDRFCRIDSPIHRLAPRFKVPLLIVLLMVIAASPLSHPEVFITAGVILLVTALMSRVPLLFLLQRMLLAEFFVLWIAAFSLLQSGGLSIFAGIVTRSSFCLAAVILFSTTTPFSALLQTLKRWRVPGLMITLLALMYRYVFVLSDEMGRMLRARRSRTFGSGHATVWASLATLVAQLFVRSTERAERIFSAMVARGWR
jgi:cobalt/nickel transport system permease protein